MSISGKVVDGYYEITETYRVPVAKRDVILNAAQYYFESFDYLEDDGRAFEELSNDEILLLLEKHKISVHKNSAEANYKLHRQSETDSESGLFIEENFEIEV